jgi:hypothetical protein
MWVEWTEINDIEKLKSGEYEMYVNGVKVQEKEFSKSSFRIKSFRQEDNVIDIILNKDREVMHIAKGIKIIIKDYLTYRKKEEKRRGKGSTD